MVYKKKKLRFWRMWLWHWILLTILLFYTYQIFIHHFYFNMLNNRYNRLDELLNSIKNHLLVHYFHKYHIQLQIFSLPFHLHYTFLWKLDSKRADEPLDGRRSSWPTNSCKIRRATDALPPLLWLSLDFLTR